MQNLNICVIEEMTIQKQIQWNEKCFVDFCTGIKSYTLPEEKEVWYSCLKIVHEYDIKVVALIFDGHIL